MVDIRIQAGSSAPIYRQIVDQVRWAVRTQAPDLNVPLPSVRALAEKLVINPNTVAHAYAELVREGVIEARPGKGYFTCAPRQVYSKEELRRRLEEALEEFVKETLFLGFSPVEIRSALERRLLSLSRVRKGV